jgi:hypothetical protein
LKLSSSDLGVGFTKDLKVAIINTFKELKADNDNHDSRNKEYKSRNRNYLKELSS